MEVRFSPDNAAVAEALLADPAAGRDAFFAALRWSGGRKEEDDLLLPRVLPFLHLYSHQQKVVRQVVNELAGRALLADGVGLGKTIEAGACLAEWRARGLVRRALVLAPAALLSQWAAELRRHFGLAGVLARAPRDWRGELVIGSLDLAKRPEHARVILERPYDLVVVDEAHRLKNHRTANWGLVWEIETTYLLLLTATPLQNDLRELYNLVTLVRPGLFSTPAEFRRVFQLDRLRPRNPDLLRERLGTVMLRADWRSASLAFPPRRVTTLEVALSPEEEALYAACLALLAEARDLGRSRQQVLPLVVVLREATSSPEAVRRTLLRMARTPGVPGQLAVGYREVAARAKEVVCRKAGLLRDLVVRRREKVVVFTEFRGTQDTLARELAEAGVAAVVYHGGLSPAAREAAVKEFAGPTRVMIATEAGAEGYNLQFCHWLINYDLPWNPMRLEQRIGRVHRLGQAETVEITNLVTERTIEAHVLAILGAKLELCETVLGELDLILEHGLERRIAELVLEARTAQDLDNGFSRLRREIAERRAAFAAAARRNDELLGLAGSGAGAAGE
ncbi:MAG: SNF2-related protein [Bacillota bacterium]|nr:SNF2-related protein [Bacillota bacterium]